MLAIQTATRTSTWLRTVARKYDMPVAEIRRKLRTTKALADEIAIIIDNHCRDEARDLVMQDEHPPEGKGLISRLTRNYYHDMMAAKKEQARIQAANQFAALKRQQDKDEAEKQRKRS